MRPKKIKYYWHSDESQEISQDKALELITSRYKEPKFILKAYESMAKDEGNKVIRLKFTWLEIRAE
jgi:hypothetical protein